eukprot:gene58118-biopygen71387
MHVTVRLPPSVAGPDFTLAAGPGTPAARPGRGAAAQRSSYQRRRGLGERAADGLVSHSVSRTTGHGSCAHSVSPLTDLTVMPYWEQFAACGVPTAAVPQLEAWWERCRNRPAWQYVLSLAAQPAAPKV